MEILRQTLDNGEKVHEICKIEKFNRHNMLNHIYSGYVDLDYSRELRKYLNKANTNSIKIYYDVPTIGRLKTNVKDNKGNKIFVQSQMYQWKQTKYEICRDYYDDVDIVNCQSVLLKQIMEYHNLPTSAITKFNKNRETILLNIMKKNNINRDQAKEAIIPLVFCKTNNKAVLTQLKPFKGIEVVQQYKNELHKNRKELLKLYPEFIEHAKLKKGKDYENIEGSAFSYLTQTLERICLLSMVDFYEHNNCTIGALIHDGLHLEKHTDNTKNLKLCEQWVYEHTGCKITLKIKPFEAVKDMKKQINFNLIDEKQNSNVTVHNINSEFLVKLNENDNKGCNLVDEINNNKISLIASYTGSGKTQLIKQLIKKYSESNPNLDEDDDINTPHKVISIVSRVSLADMHTIELGLSNYLEVHDHGLNEVYQLDSVNKVNNLDGNRYILVLDEVASLCSHYLNHMNKMSKERLQLVKKLDEIINHPNCTLVIGVDANINQGTINFISSSFNKPIDLYINDYIKYRDTPIYHYENKFTLVKRAIKLLKEGETVYLCSNMNDDFKRDIVYPILKETEIKKENYLIYSGDEGERRIDTRLWKDKKLIIATPTIIYGCDSNYSFHVVGFYFNAPHFDAMDINQQLNRERKPKTINLYMADMINTPFKNIEEAKEFGTLDIKQVSKREQLKYKKYDDALTDLLFYEDYRKSYHNNVRHFIFDLLRSKGYTNIQHIISKGDIKTKITRNEYNDIIIKAFKNDTIDDKKYDDILDKMNYFNMNINDEITLGKHLNNPTLQDAYKNIIDKYLNVFTDRKKFEDLKKYLRFKYTKYNKLNNEYSFSVESEAKFNNTLTYEIDNLDILTSITKTDIFKVELLKKLKDILNLEDGKEIESINRNNFNDKVDINKDLMNNIMKAFRIRGKQPKYTRAHLVSFYMSKLKSLLGSCIITKHKNKTFKIDKVKQVFSINVWDSEVIEPFNKIVEYSNMYKEALFVDYNEYQFIDKPTEEPIDDIEHEDKLTISFD